MVSLVCGGSGKTRFIRFLVQRLVLTNDAAERVAEGTRNFREAPAGIALRHGLLDPLALETVTVSDNGDFLDAAEQQGLLSPATGERIRTLFELHELISVGELLVLEGWITAERLKSELAAFLAEAASQLQFAEPHKEGTE